MRLEACENYQKQSWRNRCNILSAGGVEPLQVPVVHRDGTFRHPIREVEVDYSRDFVTRHLRAIDSAYMSSAYYTYYREEIYSLLEARPALLWDLNMSIIEFFCRTLGLKVPGLTESFEGRCEDIHPKHPDPYAGLQEPYFQVFSTRHGFCPNLSVMDLLFNEGPSSLL